MKHRFRLLLTGNGDPCWNMSLDEAIMTLRPETGVNTLRLYGWDPSAVSVGYFESLKEVVDLQEVESRGMKYIRRITGGGAVYHDTAGELTYSIVVPDKDPILPKKVLDSYFALCGGIVLGLGKLGIEAEFAPINDIVVGGKKISGNAQTRKRGIVLQHGTILYRVDPELMFTLLRVSDEKMKDKLIAAVQERVTSVSHIDPGIGRDRLEKAMVDGFAEHLNAELEPGEPTDEEIELAKKLMRDKYATEEWNFKR